MKFPSEVTNILEKGLFAYLSSVSIRNQPVVSPIIYVFDKENWQIYFLMTLNSAKARNISKNPTVSFVVDSRDIVNPSNNTGVMVTGSSKIEKFDLNLEYVAQLSRQFEVKYPGWTKYSRLWQNKVIVKVTPLKYVHWKGVKFTTVEVDEGLAWIETTFPVVTISRQVGSGGDVVAKRLCKLTGYKYVDKDVMIKTASDVGLTFEEFMDLPEDSYKLRSWLDRLLRRNRFLINETKTVPDSKESILYEKSSDILRTIMTTLHKLGRIVIVGRGGQALLKNSKNTFHVRIVAPNNVRIKAIVEQYGLNRVDAVKFMHERDRAAAQYLKRFYGIDWDDPKLYDMKIDMRKVDVESAARAIAEAIMRR